jgi:hypothetical protein
MALISGQITAVTDRRMPDEIAILLCASAA